MSNPVSSSTRLESALAQTSLVLRCDELSRLLLDISNKEAAFVLRRIIESIFGVNGYPGWGIKHITLTEHRHEFNQIRAFLSPTGPLLSLTYRLAHDPFHSLLLIEFPISYLPARIKADLEDGTAGIFYTSKIQNPGPGKVPSHILLNAFEFYMFHFAYFLVGGNNKYPMSWIALNDALFPVILEDYLLEFLPCDASVPPGPPSPPTSPRSVLMPYVQSGGGGSNLHITNIVSPIGRRSHTPGLDMSGLGGIHASSPIHPNHQPQTANIWTSQVVAQILLEMWVNHSLPSTKSPRPPGLTNQQSGSNNIHQFMPVYGSSLGSYTDYTPIEYRPNWNTAVFEVFVPSNDHVKVVRMLVKHLHYFSNSIKPGQPTSLDELKKNLWTMCRKSLYHFLKHLFNHWPLDSSFRLVLELWLSYIQPWRYTDYNNILRPNCNAPDNEANVRNMEPHWQSFMAENFLFYTLLAELLLGRLLRLDLSANRNANILFRLTKVYSQSNFINYLLNIEEALESSYLVQRTMFGTPTPNLRPMSQNNSDGAPTLQTLVTFARKNIVDMEGTNFTYVPLFGEQITQIVNNLQKAMHAAYSSISNEIASVAAKPSNRTKSWLSSFLAGIFDPSTQSEDDATVDEAKKTLLHLEVSLQNLSSIFNLPYPLESLNNETCMNDSLISNISTHDPHIPDQVNTPFGPVLSTYGRQQLLRGLRRYDLKYEGDPDLRLICSNEVPFLVRWLHRLSVKVNEKYRNEIKEAFFRNDFVGRLSRVCIKPPETVYEYVKGPFGSPTKKISKRLPARLSFRFLADKRVIMLLFLLYIFFCVMLSYSTPGLIIKFILPTVISYFVIMALFSSNSPPEMDPVSELTFNDISRVAADETRGF